MKVTLTLISFLRTVFFTDRSTVPDMTDGSLKKSALFSASQISCYEMSSNNYSVVNFFDEL